MLRRHLRVVDVTGPPLCPDTTGAICCLPLRIQLMARRSLAALLIGSAAVCDGQSTNPIVADGRVVDGLGGNRHRLAEHRNHLSRQEREDGDDRAGDHESLSHGELFLRSRRLETRDEKLLRKKLNKEAKDTDADATEARTHAEKREKKQRNKELKAAAEAVRDEGDGCICEPDVSRQSSSVEPDPDEDEDEDDEGDDEGAQDQEAGIAETALGKKKWEARKKDKEAQGGDLLEEIDDEAAQNDRPWEAETALSKKKWEAQQKKKQGWNLLEKIYGRKDQESRRNLEHNSGKRSKGEKPGGESTLSPAAAHEPSGKSEKKSKKTPKSGKSKSGKKSCVCPEYFTSFETGVFPDDYPEWEASGDPGQRWDRSQERAHSGLSSIEAPALDQSGMATVTYTTGPDSPAGEFSMWYDSDAVWPHHELLVLVDGHIVANLGSTQSFTQKLVPVGSGSHTMTIEYVYTSGMGDGFTPPPDGYVGKVFVDDVQYKALSDLSPTMVRLFADSLANNSSSSASDPQPFSLPHERCPRIPRRSPRRRMSSSQHLRRRRW